jgi:hypothetical protein
MKKEIDDLTPMNSNGRMVVILVMTLFFTGCVTPDRNHDITVINLDSGGFTQDTVGNFDVYTGNFLVTNPTNNTFDNVEVDISLAPTAAYCHGLTKTFSVPRFSPLEKRKVQLSIAEFGDLDCQYNYTYQVFFHNTG